MKKPFAFDLGPTVQQIKPTYDVRGDLARGRPWCVRTVSHGPRGPRYNRGREANESVGYLAFFFQTHTVITSIPLPIRVLFSSWLRTALVYISNS